MNYIITGLAIIAIFGKGLSLTQLGIASSICVMRLGLGF